MSHRPGPVCTNGDCPCAIPGSVCEEFKDYLDEYCAECGYEASDHDR